MTKNRIRYFHFLLLLFIGGTLQSQDLETILHKYYEKSGGIENWKSLKSVIYCGKNKAVEDMMFGKGDFEYSYHIKINRKESNAEIFERWLSINEKHTQDTFSTCYNGENYWIQGTHKTPQSFIDYAPIYGSFVRLSDPSLLLSADSIKWEGRKIIRVDEENRESYVIKLFLRSGRTVIYFIDTNSYVLNGSSLDLPNATLTVYSDYRLIDELSFPFREVTLKKGEIIGEWKLDKILINRSVPDYIFEFPKYPNRIFNKYFNLSFN